jgi:Leucine-rich repeat (LRR) protein
MLRNLSMSANLIYSTIPPALGNLTQLHELDLSYNVMSGTIPGVSANLTSLNKLDLGFNRWFNGTIPEWVCAQSALRKLHLGGNFLTGTIPECLGSLALMINIELQSNLISGTIPSLLGELPGLSTVLLEGNLLNGTVPQSFTQLAQLSYLRLGANYLSGSVASMLGSWPLLEVVDFSNCWFTGTLPDEIGTLTRLTTLYTYNSLFSGTFPETLGGLVALLIFDMDENFFSGSLPSGLGDCQQLQYISVYNCMLSGTLPASLGNLAFIEEVDLDENSLSGSISADLERMTSLQALVLSHNALSGSIPAALLALQEMRAVEVSANYITGTLPESTAPLQFFGCGDNYVSGTVANSIVIAPYLLYFNVSNNYLTGTIPNSIATANNINYLYLSGNQLTGTIPNFWTASSPLSYVYCDINLLTGSFPSSLGGAPLLQSVNASSNLLSGTIPLSLAALSMLEVLLLQNNRLTGPLLSEMFDADIQTALQTVQVSGNQLTGELPAVLGNLPNLRVFAAVSNCFTGSIPLSLCSSGSLVTLALDGLQSATSCQRRLFPAALEGSVVANSLYLIRSPLSGGVPSCLFGMINLTTLHLSGNGLTGTLPADLYVSNALTDLSLSHNKLHGSIPRQLLSRAWLNFDLSYNRLTGALEVDSSQAAYTNRTAIYIERNRLSGKVPSALTAVSTISILESNIFSCRSDQSGLPGSDPNKDRYQCASNTFDAALYSWLSILAAVAVVIFLAVRVEALRPWMTASLADVRGWWQASDSLAGPRLKAFWATASQVLQVAVGGAAYAVLLLLPAFAICTAYFGTYGHQYAWTIAAAYFSGSAPFAVEFALWSLLLLLVLACVCTVKSSADPTEDTNDRGAAESPGSAFTIRTVLTFASYLALNFFVVVGVNTAYVIIALNKNGEALTFAQIALALFKVVFSGVCSPMLMRWLGQRFLPTRVNQQHFIMVQLAVGLVNNILIPCMVVSVISPDCFYNIFKSASTVDSNFEYRGKCVAFDPSNRHLILCTEQEIQTAQTSYSPPFNYSYQCSSSFITYYAPAYVIMCIIAGLALPLAQLLLQWLHCRAVRGTRWFALLDAVLPRIMKPMIADASEASAAVISPYLPYFDASQHLITLLTYLALLLTFGAVFPPLAVCFAVTMLCMAGFTRLKVGRFLFNAHAQGLAGCAAAVEQECGGVGGTGLLRRSVGMVVSFSCLFYTLFLFDTLGDAEGLSGAYWVLIVVPLLVALGGLAAFLVSQLSGRKGCARVEGKPAEPGVVEMPTRSPLAAPASAADDAL